MMKKFIFCLCVALAFVACTEEGEPSNNTTKNEGLNPSNEKRVSCIVEVNSRMSELPNGQVQKDEYTNSYDFFYDQSGRLIKYVGREGSPFSSDYEDRFETLLTYGKNRVSLEGNSNSNQDGAPKVLWESELTLDNQGRGVSCYFNEDVFYTESPSGTALGSAPNHYLYYNEAGYLTSVTCFLSDGEEIGYKLGWNAGNLEYINDEYEGHTTQIFYGNLPNKGYVDLAELFGLGQGDLIGDDLLGALGYMGKRSAYMPTRIDSKYYSISFSYETDSEGYITRIKSEEEHSSYIVEKEAKIYYE